MTEVLSSAIVGHLVGDYLLQNDWMALNKKKSTLPCVIHCALWTIAVCVFADWPLQGWIPAILFATHFLQDRTQVISFWMTRINSQSRFMRCDDFDMTDMRVIPGLGPWSVIVVDNVWHIVTIWAVWKFIA